MALQHLEHIARTQSPSSSAKRLRALIEALIEALRKGLRRFCLFAISGLSVFVVGIAIQIVLIHYAKMSHDRSYIVQTLISVQLNFLLSRYLTWRDRATPFLGALGRFNTQQLATTGLGMLLYMGLEQFKVNYITANVVVTAFLTPVSFLISHHWSLRERESRVTFQTLPWPLFLVLAVQVPLSLRLMRTNTAFLDEATYLYAGSQELNHWIHGIQVADYQDFFSGSPAVYPPLGAMANAVGGLTGARLLGLFFILGTTSLLYMTTKRLFGVSAAFLGTAVFAGLGVTQFLSAFATFDPMALFLLALASYLAIGREHAYKNLSDVALSTILAATILALANACKYATALWDPVVIGLALCAPPMAGYSWRYGLERALQFVLVLSSLLVIGISIGKAKYIHGILSTTIARSSTTAGMGQPASLVITDAWQWVGIVFVAAAIGTVLLLLDWRRIPFAVTGLILLTATVAAPLNQARIGTTVSLQKHVVFGAWFGCILAGYALSRLLRYKWASSVTAVIVLIGMSAIYMTQASDLFHTWNTENPAFIAALKKYVHPGGGRYLIEGYSDIPAYYIGPSVTSIQWKETISYSYQDPRTGVTLNGPPAISSAVQNKVFSAVILNFTPGSANEIANDDAVVASISKFGGYRKVAELPASSIGSHDMYTVWERVGS